ncbi:MULTISPECIES: S1/P1 nuclease [unclassified Bradyrhizobium]|uniref:S1/P1 nuclease n=1 Tax=unclassified Bradyrhizobium TaxID=2631580 RepID=UPI002479CE72|nr:MULTISPECIES: S1/P1 nuclease [unclassified Bradyrhizobium]WGR73295.1 S1/P1 nuclease [Bradyrhizobium sp. ISRA426]WGR78132.1 S1/P1 nuclease [Bradyrhizobium sp. ISRA430]WGR88533.1 S1/P1 nuclease [Bradyrhizobium sp. ISRA432]
MRAVWLAWLVLGVSVSQAWSWGQEGHAIVAEIAQRRLDPATLGKIEGLLAQEAPGLDHPNVTLASIASWADDYRADHKDTAGWHFVDMPDDRSTYDPDADCKNGNCVVEAIARFRAVLGDCSKPASERLQALKFIVHFVGDIHQPLHASDRSDAYTGKDDQGGNLVPVTFFGQTTNLHTLWDTGLIMRTVYNWGAYVVRLETVWFPGRDLTGLKGGSPAEWAVDAHRLGHEIAYDIPDDGVLGVKYFSKASPIVDRQLALAGIRLAQLLRDTLATAACQ